MRHKVTRFYDANLLNRLALNLLGILHFSLSIAYLQFRGGIGKVFARNDVVPIEDGAGFVSADFHRNNFRHSSPNHIANGAAAQIVKEQASATGSGSYP